MWGGGGEFGRRVTDTDYQLRFSLSTCLVHPFFPCRPLCMWLWICKQNNEFEASRAGCLQTFYGRREYNPSGKVDGEYAGLGLTDIRRIKKREESVEKYLLERQRQAGDSVEHEKF